VEFEVARKYHIPYYTVPINEHIFPDLQTDDDEEDE